MLYVLTSPHFHSIFHTILPLDPRELSSQQVAELEFVLGNVGDCSAHLDRAERILSLTMGSDGGKRHVERIRQLRELLKQS